MHAPAASNIVFHPRAASALTLRNARPGDVFFVGEERRALFSLLSHNQVDASTDLQRRWCVVVATNDSELLPGTLMGFDASAPVIPVRFLTGSIRVVADPQGWADR